MTERKPPQPRILLVDDNPDDRLLVIRELRKDHPGVAVSQVSAPDALEAALSGRSCDLVITDFHLRWSTGLEVFKRVRARWPDMPVIMFTGTGTEEVAVEAMRIGLFDYVVKAPRHMSRLRRAVQAALTQSDEARARQRAEKLLTDALQYIEDGFILFDASDRIIMCNDQLRSMYSEISHLLVPGTTFTELIEAGLKAGQYRLAPRDRERWLEERIAAHRRASGSIEQQLADGRWVLIKERRSHDGGYLSIYTDITALKRREFELERVLAEHAMLAAAAQQSSAGIVVTDGERWDDGYPIIYINPAFERITGYRLKELRGRDCRLLQGGETSAESRARIRAALAEHRPVELEIVNYRKNGEKFWNALSISPVFGDNGVPRFFVGVLTDISERVRIRDALEERTEMLAEAERLAHLGHWRWDIVTDRLWWSEEIYRIRGLDPKTVQPDFNRTLATYHPEDQPYVEKCVRGVAATHESTEFEARIVRPDGELRYVRVKGQYSPAAGPDKHESVFGIFQDITAQKQQELALRRSERRNRRLMEAIPHGVKEIAVDGTITYANQAHHKMLGYPRGELIGKAVFDLIADAAHRTEAERRFRMLMSGESFAQSFASRYRTADGRGIDVQVDAVISRSEAGRVNGVIAVATDVTERVRGEERLRYLAFHDPLTDLGNRALLNERLRELLARRREGESVALALFNIDGFKLINDALGHDVGDGLLRELGARLAAACGTGETVAHLGADEFAVVIVGEVGPAALRLKLQEIKNAVEAPLQLAGTRLDVRLSVGVAVAPEDAAEAGELLRNADSALLEAKRNTPGDLGFYSAETKALVEEFLLLRGRLRSAALQGEFYLEYQPQVEIASGRIRGIEALVRWRTEDGELIPPAKFIPIAEASGDIIALGGWVLESACRQAVAWERAGIPITPISVNVSARQLLQEDLVAAVTGVLQHTGLDPQRLQLELTETALLGSTAGVAQRMRELVALGIRFSLDDFGTGYSSLSYLSRLPIHTLKIDRSFVVGMSKDARHAAIVSAVVAMSRELDIRVVAEGVEDARQAQALLAAGCELAQGFYYSHPLSADGCAALLRTGTIRTGR